MTIFLYVLENGRDMQYATSTQAAIVGGKVIRAFVQMATPVFSKHRQGRNLMTFRQKAVTQWLFWGAFAVFLGVSIPHIAWVVKQYEPHNSVFVETCFWGLAFGYAIALDGVMAWLTHVQSTAGGSRWDKATTWAFIVVLVAMSWYLNWVFDLAHDPSKQAGVVWQYQLTGQIGSVAPITIGGFTPVLLGALPVFTIAYVSILSKVNKMKEQAAKSVEMLEAEAAEAERRAIASRRIREAQQGAAPSIDIFDKGASLLKGAIKAGKSVSSELVKDKVDPQAETLERVLALFRDTPDLLQGENAALAETAIQQMLKLGRKQQDVATFWRIKAAQILTQPQVTTAKQDLMMPMYDFVDEVSQDNQIALSTDEHQINAFVSMDDERQTDVITPFSEPRTDVLDQQKEERANLADASLREYAESSDLFGLQLGQDTEGLQIIPSDELRQFVQENDLSNRSNRPRYITFDDASKLTGYSIDTLKRKANRGEIRRHPTDSNRLLTSTVQDLRNPRQTQKMSVLQTVN
jgi:hypothetical protein